MGSERWREVASAAAAQHGVVDLRLLRTCDVPRHAADRWASSDRLVRRGRSVWTVAGAPTSYEQEVLVAVTAAGPGAAASHRTAAHLWDLIARREQDPIEVVLPWHRRSRTPLAVVHRSGDLVPEHLTTHGAIPITIPVRTVVDLGATAPDFVVERALEKGLMTGTLTLAGVEWFRAALSEHGRDGVGVLGRVLDARALLAPPESLLEPRFARLVASAGLPRPVFQHWVVIRGRRYRLDFAYPELGIAIEVDGFDPHARREVFDGERTRHNDLVAAGWAVIRVTWTAIVKRPDLVASQLRTTIDTRRRAG